MCAVSKIDQDVNTELAKVLEILQLGVLYYSHYQNFAIALL